MTSSPVSPLSEAISRIDPQSAQQVVGGLSVALGSLAVLAPVRTAAAFGVRGGSAGPLLVRMVGVRNATAGALTMQATGEARTKALQAGLVLGVVDAASVLLAYKRGAMSRRAALGGLAVLGAIAVLGVAAGRE